MAYEIIFFYNWVVFHLANYMVAGSGILDTFQVHDLNKISQMVY